MNGLTGFNFHRGCLALGVRPPARDWRDVVEGAGLGIASANQEPAAPVLLALERVGNVDNVGAIFRNAAAFGAGGRPPAGRLRRPALSQGHPHVDGCVAGHTVCNGAVAGGTPRSRRSRMGNSGNDASSRGAPAAGCLPVADRAIRRHCPGPRRRRPDQRGDERVYPPRAHRDSQPCGLGERGDSSRHRAIRTTQTL